MANAKVRLLKSVKVKEAWVKCPVVLGKDGKHKLSRVMVAGHEEEHQLGVYHLDYRVGTIRKCVAVQGVLGVTGRKGFTALNIKGSEIGLAINNTASLGRTQK